MTDRDRRNTITRTPPGTEPVHAGCESDLAYDIACQRIAKRGRTYFTLHIDPLFTTPTTKSGPAEATGEALPQLRPVALEVCHAISLREDSVHLVTRDPADGDHTMYFEFIVTDDGLVLSDALKGPHGLSDRLNDRHSRIIRALLRLVDVEGIEPIVDILTTWLEHVEATDAPMGASVRRGAGLVWAITRGLSPALTRVLRDQAAAWDGPVSDLGRSLVAAAST